MDARGSGGRAGEFDPGGVAVVTGGAGGLGSAMARELADAGMVVAILDLPQTESAARSLIDSLDPPGVFYGLDLRDAERVREAFARIDDEVGAPAVLINNAGTAIRAPALEVTLEDWQLQIDLNLTAAFVCAQAFARRAADAIAADRIPRAAVVNVASILGLVGAPNRAAYSATKGAIVNLTRTLALEWHELGIRVNAVAPAFVLTPLTRPLHEQGMDIPVHSIGGRWADPEDVAAAVRFLASDRARAIVGHTLPVDFGWAAS
jgi:NAD(P)-dependent dehydrogenase (short-subunit alcohol dehydrogenase family)